MIINLPDEFNGHSRVMVTGAEVSDKNAEKLLSLQKASTDKLFLQDVAEVEKDFNFINNFKEE